MSWISPASRVNALKKGSGQMWLKMSIFFMRAPPLLMADHRWRTGHIAFAPDPL
jgi:hypothetical protein